jgi:hypothetical protein
MATQKDVERAAANAGLRVCTYSPGDGVTRYKFFKAEGIAPNQTYFGPANGIHTALGAAKAIAFAKGHQNGVEVNVKYKIVRFFYGDKSSRTIKGNLSLDEAQAHCNDPKTRKEGIYFDGYDVM